MKLLESYLLGLLRLSNRMVMAPMTRSRASQDGVPSPLATLYYQQRASAGLIITEGAQVSQQGIGYVRTPGIYLHEHVEAWKNITQAVHAEGGHIFLQLWHCGRVSHPDFHHGDLPVAPSAVPFHAQVYTYQGMKSTVTPRALLLDELPGIVQQFKHAAQCAQQAGFDGVEIHGANGYLIDQFLRDGTNHREDDYGGSVAHRCRLALEITQACIQVFGADRVGFRISPLNPFNDMHDSNPFATFAYLTEALSALKIAYLHVMEPLQADGQSQERISSQLRPRFNGTFIANGGYTAESAEQAIADHEADLIAFGVPFLANPDLPKRFERHAALNEVDPKTFYSGESRGYTDYPVLD